MLAIASLLLVPTMLVLYSLCACRRLTMSARQKEAEDNEQMESVTHERFFSK